MPAPRAEDVPYVVCKTLGHSWDDFNPQDMPRPPTGWRLSLRCVRCTSQRHDNLNYRGGMVNRQYIYPENYKNLIKKVTMDQKRIVLRQYLKV